jgi:hypothetical protein
MTSASLKLHHRARTCAALAVALVLAAPAELRAQSTPPAAPQKSEKSAKPEVRTDAPADKAGGAKSVAAKRQKLHDCGAKWQDEKKTKGLTGKAAYLKFLAACLKS